MNSFLLLLYLTGKPFSAVTKNIFYLSAHTYPFRRLTPPPSPTSGDGFSVRAIFLFFVFTHFKNYNFFLPWSFAVTDFGESADPCEAIGASLRTQVRTFITRILCQILHFVQE